MANALRCSIVTPSQSVLSAEATYVSFEAWDGQRGVMQGASPFLTNLGVGRARVELVGGGSKTFVIESGFAQMQGDHLTLLTDTAVASEQIDGAAAAKELADANAKAIEPGANSEDDRRRLERAQRLASSKVGVSRG